MINKYKPTSPGVSRGLTFQLNLSFECMSLDIFDWSGDLLQYRIVIATNGGLWISILLWQILGLASKFEATQFTTKY
jgi:hypothetical protein